MNYITKETLDKYVKDKKVIGLNVFTEIFEKEFGIVIPFSETIDYDNLTEVQKMKMTKAIFTNEDVLEQLRQASIHRDYIEDDEEAFNVIDGARNGK